MTTAEQLALNLSPLVEPDYAPKASIQERYEAFIAANPWVLAETERLVADLVDAGQKLIATVVIALLDRAYGRAPKHRPPR